MRELIFGKKHEHGENGTDLESRRDHGNPSAAGRQRVLRAGRRLETAGEESGRSRRRRAFFVDGGIAGEKGTGVFCQKRRQTNSRRLRADRKSIARTTIYGDGVVKKQHAGSAEEGTS